MLLSTYELGRQPFGLASPAAWLRAAGHEVTCADLACQPLPEDAVRRAEMVACFLPMHTATRLFQRVLPRIRALNPAARLCGYGLYAPLNEAMLRGMGVTDIVGGEFEQRLLDLAGGAAAVPSVSLERQKFLVPDRAGLPPLGAYAQLAVNGTRRRVGYTEGSRGCKHLCRHCPIVPVYNGRFRVVQREVVLEDIRRMVAAGAEHITFGDPDFFNGPAHAMQVAEALHAEWPDLTYDVTIKVEHLLGHSKLLPALARTGCLFVTSAVESLDDAVLDRLDKGHTRADFLEALELTRACGLALAPTFIPFTPWTTLEAYREFLRAVGELDLVPNVPPVQLVIRLLITEGSRLLELPEIREAVQPFDAESLYYPWRSELDPLHRDIRDLIKREERRGTPRAEIFCAICELAGVVDSPRPSRATIPYLTEPWYC